MIIVIIFLVMVISGIIFNQLSKKHYSEGVEFLGAFNVTIGLGCLIISIIVIIIMHSTAQKVIQENKLEYDGLCKRYEIITSEYEDVSKSDVIADITEWNTEVYSIKYWTNNYWTNWFNPKEIADNLNYILLE